MKNMLTKAAVATICFVGSVNSALAGTIETIQIYHHVSEFERRQQEELQRHMSNIQPVIPAIPSSVGSPGGTETEKEEVKTCTKNVDVEYARCESNFRNTYSITISKSCRTITNTVFNWKYFSIGSNSYDQCKDTAEARRDAGLARCKLDKAEALANTCP
ncbi:hypothetical protein RS130_08400 [Paraglaciecola aquimarina]|uniref:Orphan protein n=1 Tax=Paraglaciecola aquimarina TaxID=1235557 RepID=A0ABU3SVB2_9ALTE|nr:hypothetical protein [Paraglaciecola aquimarina]MDU0353946.1 hypothetical protein [Paraglaciecola aquimarina]